MDSDRVWNRIVAHSGDTFHQLRGKPFTYEASGRTIQLRTTERMISRSEIEKALEFVPLTNTVPVQHLSGPSYIYALLTDPRIIGETQLGDSRRHDQNGMHRTFQATVAARAGVDPERVRELIDVLRYRLRSLVREGHAVFHPGGVEAEPDHAALALVDSWPPPQGDDPVEYLQVQLARSSDELRDTCHLWPDDLLNGIDMPQADDELISLAEAFWHLMPDHQRASPFGDFDLPIVATEESLRWLLKQDSRSIADEFGTGDFEQLPNATHGAVVYRIENSADVLGVLVETTRAGGATLKRVDDLIADLRNGGIAHVACLVLADGRGPAFRSAEASREDLFYRSAQDLVLAARGELAVPEGRPSSRKPNVPERDPERRQNDPYDSDAVAFLLAHPGASPWSRGTLFEHLRGQPRLDQERVNSARSFALRHGVEVRTHPDGSTNHFFRTDSDAPFPYPMSEAERRAWRAKE